jgi:cell division protein FtsW (lipid II flippase)
VCTGLAVAYATQIFLTIGGGVKFIPLTGVTLPFISYGGSSLVVCFIAIAILEAISHKNYDTYEGEDEQIEEKCR